MSKVLTFAQVAAMTLAGTVAAQAAVDEQTNPPRQQQTNDQQAPTHERDSAREQDKENASNRDRPQPQPSTSRAEGTAADRTPPGATPKRGEPGLGTGVNPAPSTSPTEGTAADSTPPGKTPTGVFGEARQSNPESSHAPNDAQANDAQAREQRGRAEPETEAKPHPMPSTRQAEGTAADRTPPGDTSKRGETGVGTGVNPAPSTSPTEGTAADRTPPGQTPTQVFRKDKPPREQQQDPQSEQRPPQ